MKKIVFPALVVVFAFVAMMRVPALAQDAPVVARIGDETITMADVTMAHAMLPEQIRTAPLDQVYDVIVGILVDSKLAAADAKKRGLDKDPDVVRQLARVEEQILERAVLTRHIDQAITEDMVRARHQETVDAMKGENEIRVSHILLETREAAVEAIDELKGGAVFADVAKARSIGPSAPMGGEIGFISKGDTVPAFEAAAFALEEGAFSAEPVQTQFGWHVILVGEKRPRTPPAFEDVRDGIVASLSREVGLAYIKSLRDGATIERFNMDGSPQK